MRAPQVTVVLATYNWAPVLPYSIGSVLDQEFDDFELLVIGDACSDESEEVVAAIDDPRVRWINLPINTGHQYGPNNEGIRLASAKIIAFIGHDDLWLPHHLAVLVPIIAAGHAVVHSRCLVIRPDTGDVVHPGQKWSYRPGAWVPPTATAYSSDALRSVGGWRSPATTGELDPEAHLMRQVSEVYGPPAVVDHVTCIKLPASMRRDVYRHRPHHEQAHWLEVIRTSTDPSAVVAAAATGRPGYRRRVVISAQRLFDLWMRRVPRRLRPWTKSESAIERYRRARTYKGL